MSAKRKDGQLTDGPCHGSYPCSQLEEAQVCSVCGMRHVYVAVQRTRIYHLKNGHTTEACLFAAALAGLPGMRKTTGGLFGDITPSASDQG